MSKKKIDQGLVDASYNDIINSFKKDYGKDICAPSQTVIDTNLIVIPFSPKMDMGLGGGIQEGGVVVCSGHPKVGKTTSILHFCKNALKPEYGGEFCPDGRRMFYFDTEARLKKRDLEGIPGLDVDKIDVIASKKGRILAAEDYLSIAEKIVNQIPGAILFIDSASAMATSKELISSMSDMQMGDGPKLMAKWCRKCAAPIGINRCIVIYTIHLGADLGPGRIQYKEKGGQAVKYQLDTHIRAKYTEKWNIPQDSDNQIGQVVHWECVGSPLSGPGKKIKSYIRYNEGIDEVYEVMDLAVDLGLIKKSGAWYSIGEEGTEGSVKSHGLEKLRIKILEDEKLFSKIKLDVKEMLS